MAIAAFSTDYANRLIDLEIFQTASDAAAIQIQLSLTVDKNNVSRKVTGLQKLVQRYLLLLFTPKGTADFDVEYGTKFLQDIRIGGTYTREQMLHSFVFATTDAISQLRAEDDDPVVGVIPDDERIKDIKLINYNADFNTGRLFIRVRVVSRAGDSVVFVVPVGPDI